MEFKVVSFARLRPVVISALLLGAVTMASTDGTLSRPLPTLAVEPAPEPSTWAGLFVGSELTAFAGQGARSGIGGAAYAGYDRVFVNGVVLGLKGESGYVPNWVGLGRSKGLDYAATDVRVGYDVGRLMPFVTAGVALVRPRFGFDRGGLPADSFNTLVNGSGGIEATGRVGAGAVYAVTDNLSIGVAVSTVNGSGLLLP